MTPELLSGRPPAADLGEVIRVVGRVEAVLRDRHGRVKQVETVENIITTAGRAAIVDQLLGSPTLGKPTHMEVGTSATAAAVGDTTITGAFGRVALTSKTRSTNVLTMVGNFAAGVATGNLNEAGAWDANTSGNLLSRGVFGAQIPKGASDTLQVTWTWTIG